MGKENAIKLAKLEWWKDKTAEEIALVQFFIAELCMPFSVFYEALEKTLKRPVYVHELSNSDSIAAELLGNKPAPTMEDIISLIPEDKRIVLILGS